MLSLIYIKLTLVLNIYICYIELIERESQRNGYPPIINNLTFYKVSRQLFAVVGGYFRFPLKIV